MIEKIIVQLKHNSYPIIISHGLFDDPNSFLPLKSGDQAMLVTNKKVCSLYFNKVRRTLEMIGIKSDCIVLPDGEKYKNLKMLYEIFTALLQNFHNRDTTLIALGGGCIGDLAGFAAATYQRGVRCIQVPTTLLSQVDSSIGGKTAVNHALGKNMIGSFYQPTSVVIDLNCLKTLSSREISSGLAEVIKYGVALNAKFFYWLEENMDSLLRLESKSLKYCIRRCCELKSKIVSIDERENNSRSLLNFGHTYGHAIEVAMGYKNWLHGEAISVGMIMAARISEKLGQFTKEETKRIIKLLKRAGLPEIGPKQISSQTYLHHIMRDKKVLEGKLFLVLPLKIGECKIFRGISRDLILNTISDCK